MIDLSLTDDRLLNAANIRLAGHRRNFDADLHAYFMIRMYPRCDVHVHTDIDVLELRVHQRVHESASRRRSHADACLEAARRHGHAVTDTQLRRLPIYRSHLRILNDLRVGIV